MSKGVVLAFVAMVLAGCGSVPLEVSSQSRAISSDIAATHQTIPSVVTQAQRQRSEPYGALPWEIEGGR